MPLKVKNGTSLSPGAAATQQHLVRIPHRPQKGRRWCWAACIQMVLEHNNIKMSQCKIVRTKLNDHQSTCADLEDTSCRAREMKPMWKQLGIENVRPKDFHLGVAKIKSEIAADRPVQVGILWDDDEGGGGHALLIKGWAATSPVTLLIDDPLRQSSVGTSKFGTGRATHAELKNALGHGTWRYTWHNLE